MLNLLHIPDDVFQLFMVSDVVISRFGTLLAAMHVLVLSLLGTFALKGLLTIQLNKLLRYAAVTLVLTLSTIFGARLFLNLFEPSYTKYQTFIEMSLMNEPVPMTVQKELPPPPYMHNGQSSLLDEIIKRGKLRVGYFKDALPFAFINSGNKLVGFDIEMANLLAKELGVTIDFLRIDREKFMEQLNAGYCDIIMSGLGITTDRARKIAFSTSYVDSTMAFIVKDHRRDDFNNRTIVQSLKNPKIGIPNISYYVTRVQDYLPQAELVPLNSPREFFRGERDDLDALVYSAEAGSAWTLVYPKYTVAIPLPDIRKIPLAYAIARGDSGMLEFLNTWIELKKKDGTIKKVYDHWILGKGAEKKEPRWSIIRNVLHWVK